MKKLLLVILAAGSITAANAQKNSILLYGTAGISTDNTGTDDFKDKNTTWNFNPGIGYQFSDHSTIGLQGGYSSYKNTMDGSDEENGMNEYTVGAFYRYTHYFNKTFSIFGQVNAGYVGGNAYTYDTVFNGTSYVFEKIDQKYSGFNINAFPALAINVHNGLALNFGFGGISYQSVTFDDIEITNNQFELTFGQQLNVGISKNFACKSKGNHEPGDDLRRMEDAYDDDDAPKKSKKRSNDDE